MLRKLTSNDKKTILRMVLCVMLGIPLGRLAGVDSTYCATTALTATLLLHTDRGHLGTLMYSLRRFLVQLIMGMSVLLVVILFDSGPMSRVPLWLQFVVLAVPLVLVGQIVYHKLVPQYRYAPYVCTLSNAVLILGPTLLQHKELFLHRMYATVLGIVLGLFIKYLLTTDKSRVPLILEMLQNDFRAMEAQLEDKGEIQNSLPDGNTTSAMLSALRADAPSQWKRYGATLDVIERLDELFAAQKKLQNILQCRAIMALNPSFHQETNILLTTLLSAHRNILFGGSISDVPFFNSYYCTPTNNAEMILAASVLEYGMILQKLAKKERLLPLHNSEK